MTAKSNDAIGNPTIKEDLYFNGDNKICHSDVCQNPS